MPIILKVAFVGGIAGMALAVFLFIRAMKAADDKQKRRALQNVCFAVVLAHAALIVFFVFADVSAFERFLAILGLLYVCLRFYSHIRGLLPKKEK